MAFPVAHGGATPPVKGRTKQDYAVFTAISMGVDN
jgi:hypothetical protein